MEIRQLTSFLIISMVLVGSDSLFAAHTVKKSVVKIASPQNVVSHLISTTTLVHTTTSHATSFMPIKGIKALKKKHTIVKKKTIKKVATTASKNNLVHTKILDAKPIDPAKPPFN